MDENNDDGGFKTTFSIATRTVCFDPRKRMVLSAECRGKMIMIVRSSNEIITKTKYIPQVLGWPVHGELNAHVLARRYDRIRIYVHSLPFHCRRRRRRCRFPCGTTTLNPTHISLVRGQKKCYIFVKLCLDSFRFDGRTRYLVQTS